MPDRPPPADVAGNRWTDLAVPDLEGWTPSRAVTVVLPYYQAPEALARTLAGLAAQTYPSDLTEIIVVDDGSDPPLELADPAVNVVHQEDRGFGLARARNTGAARAGGEIIAFLDCDMVPGRDWLAAHARWHHVAADAVVNGFRRHVDFDGLGAEQVGAAVAGDRMEDLLAGRPVDEVEWIDFHMARTAELTAGHHDAFRAITGGNLSVRADTFRAMGGYDESFTRWGAEDTELAYRAYVWGALLVPERAALAWHQGRGATPDDAEQESLRIQRAKIASLIAHESFRPDRPRRTYLVPRIVVTVHGAEAPPERVIASVDALLDSDSADLAVVVEMDAGREEHVREHYRGEVRVAIARPGSGAASHPAAWARLDLVAGTRVGPGTIDLLIDRLDDVGMITIPQPDGSEAVARLTRAWQRAARLDGQDPVAAVGRLFGSATVAWQDAGFLPPPTHGAGPGWRGRLADPGSRVGKVVRYFAAVRSPGDLFRIVRWLARRARRRIGS